MPYGSYQAQPTQPAQTYSPGIDQILASLRQPQTAAGAAPSAGGRPVNANRAFQLQIDPGEGGIGTNAFPGGYLGPSHGTGGTGGQGRGERALRRQAGLMGLQNLIDMLGRQGATDPRILNQELQGIARATEGNVGDIQQSLAAAGLGGSGVGQAISGAAGEAGAERTSAAYANEAAQAEQRQRDNLRLLLDLVINPQAQRRGQNMALQAALAGAKGGGGSGLGGLGGILGPLLKLLGSGGGGGAGGSGGVNPGESGYNASGYGGSGPYGGYSGEVNGGYV